MEVRVSPGTADTIAERIDAAVQKIEEQHPFYQPLNPDGFSKAFANLEKKHPQKRSGIKLGVMYGKPGQNNPKDMFLNGLSAPFHIIFISLPPR
jgi:hypothetical protein